MRREIKSFVRRLHKDDSGAVMVLVAVAIVALLGVTALAIDLANLVYAQRRLQATTDMAAQAGALDLNCSGCTAATPVNTANTYSAVSGNLNAQPNLNVTMVSGYPALYCLQSTGVFYSSSTSTCSSSTSLANAIEVQQQATVPLIFGNLLGRLSTVTLTATSLASAKSGALPPLHVMLVIDNTGSMNNRDPTSPAPTDCGVSNPTRIECALAGAQALVNELWPTQDQVGMMVFPPMTTGTAADDATCNGSSPAVKPYGTSGTTYQVNLGTSSGLLSTYKTSNTATSLNLSSSLGTALCQSGMTTSAATCGSCMGDKVVGGEGTYLAPAIAAAQIVLTNNGAPNVQNVMIVLSDGGAGNGNGTAPTSNQCHNSVIAAHTATSLGTWVYSIAYGSSTALSPNGNSCSDTETPRISSCTTMADIASDPTKFYSDPMGAGGNNVPVNTFSLEPTNELTTDAATSSFGTVLNFASGSTSTVQVGVGVQDVTTGHTSYIPAGTTVTAKTATTVTISHHVTSTIPSGDEIQFGYSLAGSNVLYFTSGSTSTVQAGMGVQDVTNPTYIPAGTTVRATTATTVTISNNVADTIPPGDEIQFAYSFAGSTVLYFPSSESSLLATVKAGMGVADATNPLVVLAGTTVASINTTNNTVTINTGEGGITSNGSKNGVQPGDQIVFSPTGNCTSQDNPTPTDIVGIFKAIGASLSYTQLLPLSCISSGANTC